MLQHLSMLCQGKTGQGQTGFKLKEAISSTQKLSGLHFLNNRDFKSPQKDESCTTKAREIQLAFRTGNKVSASLSTLLYSIPVNCIYFYLYIAMWLIFEIYCFILSTFNITSWATVNVLQWHKISKAKAKSCLF